jgi:antiviral helicase SKI2
VKYAQLFEHLKIMKDQELLPSVVFCQSRKECGDIANNMDMSVDYTNGKQKG